MIYCSIDLETSGLEPGKHEILTFSAILENTEKKLPFEECPKINIYILRKELNGSVFALSMNSKILSSVSGYSELKTPEEKVELRRSLNAIFLPPKAVPLYFYAWCLKHLYENKVSDSILDPVFWETQEELAFRMVSDLQKSNGQIWLNAAGKNFGTFDKRFIDAIQDFEIFVRFKQRVLDPGILFVEWDKDTSLPDLTTCKERAGLDPFVSHDSLEDAWDTVQLLRKFY
jgi:hypothetical protein